MAQVALRDNWVRFHRGRRQNGSICTAWSCWLVCIGLSKWVLCTTALITKYTHFMPTYCNWKSTNSTSSSLLSPILHGILLHLLILPLTFQSLIFTSARDFSVFTCGNVANVFLRARYDLAVSGDGGTKCLCHNRTFSGERQTHYEERRALWHSEIGRLFPLLLISSLIYKFGCSNHFSKQSEEPRRKGIQGLKASIKW